MRRLDKWIGSKLFVPIIIRICQLTGITQYQFYRWAWILAILTVLYFHGGTKPWPWWALMIGGAVGFTVFLALRPDHPTDGHPFLRKIILALEPLHAVLHGLSAYDKHVLTLGCINGMMILFAEYALTIKTIPPRETEAREGKRALAKVRS